MILIIKFVLSKGNKFVDYKICAGQTDYETGYYHDTDDDKKQVHPEYFEELGEFASHQEHKAHEYDDGDEGGEQPLKRRLDKKRSTDERSRSTHKFHCVDSKSPRKDIQTYSIVYQHKRDEQEKRYEYSQNE